MVPDEVDERRRSWHRDSGAFDNGKIDRIVNTKILDKGGLVFLNFPFDPGGRS